MSVFFLAPLVVQTAISLSLVCGPISGVHFVSGLCLPLLKLGINLIPDMHNRMRFLLLQVKGTKAGF